MSLEFGAAGARAATMTADTQASGPDGWRVGAGAVARETTRSAVGDARRGASDREPGWGIASTGHRLAGGGRKNSA
jgi:hypothetical protein